MCLLTEKTCGVLASGVWVWYLLTLYKSSWYITFAVGLKCVNSLEVILNINKYDQSVRSRDCGFKSQQLQRVGTFEWPCQRPFCGLSKAFLKSIWERLTFTCWIFIRGVARLWSYLCCDLREITANRLCTDYVRRCCKEMGTRIAT